jgi:2-polyprenyl-3-methyl-5-hydroxy-6-metoxy-1,4-benzoquinol methylase
MSNVPSGQEFDDVSRDTRRDRALAAGIEPYVAGKTLLELGCGEGHLTATVFRHARQITGIDISPIAISRASALALPNATFRVANFRDVDVAGFDVIAAIECLYYLTASEQEQFYRKLATQSPGKVFILSGPIIGSNEYRTYFTHKDIENTFARHGFSMIDWWNLNAYRRAGVVATIAAAASRLPLGSMLITSLPERYVYQRCYVAKIGSV